MAEVKSRFDAALKNLPWEAVPSSSDYHGHEIGPKEMSGVQTLLETGTQDAVAVSQTERAVALLALHSPNLVQTLKDMHHTCELLLQVVDVPKNVKKLLRARRAQIRAALNPKGKLP